MRIASLKRIFPAVFVVGCLATKLSASDDRLIEAVKRRDAKAFETLMAQRVDVNTAAPDGATPLSWAIFLGLREIAENLISAGAKINTAGEYGETPLTLALANGDALLVEKLLKAGADPKVTRWNGETTLMIAAGAGNVDAVRMLLDLKGDVGVDVNGADAKRHQNALMWAASEGHADIVELLLEKGAKVDAVSKAGFTPLVFATLKGDVPSVQRLLKAGADANHALPDKTRVLSMAVSNRSHSAAIALLDGGADPNVADGTGNTPLHLAAQAGALKLVQKLLAKSANLNVQNLPTKQVGFRSNPGLLTPLLMAARSNRVDVMRALVQAGADIKIKGQDGAGLLLASAASGRVAAVKYAFELDKDLKAVDNNGRTAMHMSVSPGGGATQDDMTELVQYLADIGVPLDEKDARGRTPIQVGDVIPLDKPIQRIADIIVSRGATPLYFPKEYIKPGSKPVTTH